MKAQRNESEVKRAETGGESQQQPKGKPARSREREGEKTKER
jgi:hypothetical protein